MYVKASFIAITKIKIISFIIDAETVQMLFVHFNLIHASSDMTLIPPYTHSHQSSRSFYISFYSINNACTCTVFKPTLIVITKLQEGFCISPLCTSLCFSNFFNPPLLPPTRWMRSSTLCVCYFLFYFIPDFERWRPSKVI